MKNKLIIDTIRPVLKLVNNNNEKGLFKMNDNFTVSELLEANFNFSCDFEGDNVNDFNYNFSASENNETVYDQNITKMQMDQLVDNCNKIIQSFTLDQLIDNCKKIRQSVTFNDRGLFEKGEFEALRARAKIKAQQEGDIFEQELLALIN